MKAVLRNLPKMLIAATALLMLGGCYYPYPAYYTRPGVVYDDGTATGPAYNGDSGYYAPAPAYYGGPYYAGYGYPYYGYGYAPYYWGFPIGLSFGYSYYGGGHYHGGHGGHGGHHH